MGMAIPKAMAVVSLGFLVMKVVKNADALNGVVKYIIKEVCLCSLVIS